MNWLRTFSYYLTAFVGGALAWGTTYYLYKRFGSSLALSASDDPYYLIIMVVPILQNALPQLLAAIVLRKLARRFAWRRWWQWLLAGSVLSLAVVYGFGRLGLLIEGNRLPPELQSLKLLLFLALMGPIMASIQPLWVPVAAVAATSLLLWLVENVIGRGKPGAA